MDLQLLTTVVLPIALVIIMFGLGLTLTLSDFKRVASFPKPVLIGLFCQMCLLPAVAFLLCYLFKLSPEFSIGLIVLAASPGGVTSNIYSHLAGGDVALNLTLTAINSVLAAISLPFFTGLAIFTFAQQGQNIDLQYKKIIEVFFIVLIPAAIGMWIKKIKPQLAEKSDKFVRVFSITVLVCIILLAISKEWRLLVDHIHEVGTAVLLFNLISLFTGYYVPRFFKIEKKQATAISLEVGIHNGTLALYMAIAVLGGGAFAVPAAVYSILMYITATVFCWQLKRT